MARRVGRVLIGRCEKVVTLDGWHSLHFLHFYDAAAAAMLSYKDTANPKLAKPAPFVPDDTTDCQVRSSPVSTTLGIVR